jgi:hypothetical protein
MKLQGRRANYAYKQAPINEAKAVRRNEVLGMRAEDVRTTENDKIKVALRRKELAAKKKEAKKKAKDERANNKVRSLDYYIQLPPPPKPPSPTRATRSSAIPKKTK